MGRARKGLERFRAISVHFRSGCFAHSRKGSPTAGGFAALWHPAPACKTLHHNRHSLNRKSFILNTVCQTRNSNRLCDVIAIGMLSAIRTVCYQPICRPRSSRAHRKTHPE